jgi:diguanylate cyclase
LSAVSGVSGISTRGWLKLTQWTVFGTLGCIAISVTFNYLYFANESPAHLTKALVSAAIIPVILAGPLFFYLTLKLRELAIANHRLQELASTDSLTGCLNRGAFTRVIENFLEFRGAGKPPTGALLVIDADHFKSINDRFGHHSGDEALNLIAAAIRASLRKDDWLGRIGGEEFGVFLPKADLAQASQVAERVRKMVSAVDFIANGEPCDLSVSVGGAAFARRISFGDLFRIADDRLYTAKKTGRDRVEMTHVPAAGFVIEAPLTVH